MGFIFGRALRDEPECPGVRMQDGELRPCSGASPKDTSADPSKEETKRVVTLVHGTFAKHAPWMRDGSELCTELRKELQGTVLRRFCWSGGNSHAARLQAGDDLAKYLLTVKKDFPEAQHFVIAHSHGGNVALYAMEKTSPDAKLGEDVAGIVTLATPFITLRKRQLPRFVIPSALFALAFIFVVSAVVVINPLKRALLWRPTLPRPKSARPNLARPRLARPKLRWPPHRDRSIGRR